MNMIQVEHLSKVYGKGENEVLALNDVSFSVKKGEFVAIIGPSGSGKSTLLHILGGVDRPTKGKVYFDGVDVYQQKEDQLAIFRRRQVGLIYQFYNLIPILNVVENMTLPVLMDGREVNQEFLTELVATLGLEGKEKKLPNELSGGQQQRTSIGRALMTSPLVVLADEPTGNLDSKSGKVVAEEFRKINEELGKTLLMVTHDPQMASRCKRVIFLKDGYVMNDVRKEGTEEEFYRTIIGETSEKHGIVELNSTQQEIVKLLLENNQLSAAKLVEKIGVASRNIESNIKKLKELGILIRHGSPKNGYWEVIDCGKKNNEDTE